MTELQGYRAFLEFLPDAFLAYDLEGHLIDVNRQACEWLGYTRSEILQQTIAQVATEFKHEDSHPAAPWQGLLMRKNGTSLPVEAYAWADLIDGRRTVLMLMHDMTARNQANDRLARMVKLYKALSEINQALVRMDHEKDLFPLVCQVAVKFGGMKLAWVGRVDESGTRIKPIVSYGSDLEYLSDIRILATGDRPEALGPVGLAFREGRNVIVNDLAHDPLMKPWRLRASHFSLGSVATFPIQRGGVPFAVLVVYHEYPGAFDEETVDLLDEMARDISFALDNFDRQEARLRLETQLKESEARLRLTLEATHIGVWDWDMRSDRWYATPTYFEMLGYDPEDIGQTREIWGERVHPEDHDFVIGKMVEVREGGVNGFNIEFRFRHANGSYRWINSLGRAIEFDAQGCATRMLGLQIDITERREAAEALRASEDKLSKIFHNSLNPISITRLDDGVVIDANEAWLGLAGHNAYEVIGRSTLELGIWAHPEERTSVVAELKQTGRIQNREFIFKTRAGDKPFLVSAELIKHGEDTCIVLVAQDISELKEALAALEEQNNFLDSILESEPECVKVVSCDGRLQQMNKAGLAMLEVDTLAEAQQIGLMEFLPPDSRSAFAHFHRQICAGSSGVFEFPIVGRKGTRRWLETHAAPLRNAAGDIMALLGVTRDVTERKQSEEVIWRQANFDLQTGLPNRFMFYDRLEQEIKKAHRYKSVLALFFIDLDRFKEVNDALGHSAADEVLVEAARRIQSCVRESDTVARVGGDEFTVLLPQEHPSPHIENVAKDILQRLSQPFFSDHGRVPAYLSASIGISFYPADASGADELLNNADQAMYVAKREGRSRHSFFTRALQERTQRRVGLLNDLRGAIAGNQLILMFQPIIDLSSGATAKAEALIRWQHPRLGLIGPPEFIPLAEESGLIIDIGDWAFREATRWASRWARGCPVGCQVSVNMSAVQFQSKPEMLKGWLEHLNALGLSGKNVVIEITESVLLDAESAAMDQLLSFRDANIQVAIDDFGTGYSSLSYLKKFHIDYLKIDKAFVHDMETDSGNRALSEAIIVMAHKLGLRVIAEGVENERQRALLTEAGCDYAQGYLFSRPQLPQQFETMLKAH